MTFSLQRSDSTWLGHVPFRTEELWKEGYQSCFTWTPGLSFSFSLSSASSAVPHASSSTPALVKNPRGSNDSNVVLPNARYNSRTRIHNTCCIICHSKSWQPPPTRKLDPRNKGLTINGVQQRLRHPAATPVYLTHTQSLQQHSIPCPMPSPLPDAGGACVAAPE